jgi:hypothetical protein
MFALHADAPYYLCALLMLTMVPVALQVVKLRR